MTPTDTVEKKKKEKMTIANEQPFLVQTEAEKKSSAFYAQARRGQLVYDAVDF